ncbi:pyridoxamine 5'-phosphate oxidase family protein [Microlunatus ginsengisoli]|uniref:pyridoxamine 5'-phosphate oxidase family protein n=1 Tax=Microlunatus ginsengisoli TaxID=363863 RepID=UPI0031DCFBF3
MSTEPTRTLPDGERTRVRRLPDRQVFDRTSLDAILDEALIAHVAYLDALPGGDEDDDIPLVLPFACARDGDTLLLHGSTGAGLLRACAAGTTISVEVTHLDALVVARSTFDHSMNYRSAVVIGVPEVVPDDEKAAALDVLVDHLLPGRSAEVRRPTRKELAATTVVRLSLATASVKVRAKGAATDPGDGEDRSVWAGILPLALVADAPVAEADVPDAVPVPPSVRAAAARE